MTYSNEYHELCRQIAELEAKNRQLWYEKASLIAIPEPTGEEKRALTRAATAKRKRKAKQAACFPKSKTMAMDPSPLNSATRSWNRPASS